MIDIASYLSQELDFLWDVHHARVETDEAEERRRAQIECQHFQQKLFHSQDLLFCVCVIGDVNEFSNLGRVNLLVFTVNSNSISLVSLNAHQMTYDAMNMAAVPTNCSLARTTDMKLRKRSM